MDATPLPVLSRWTDAEAVPAAAALHPMPELARVEHVAASPEAALAAAVAQWPGRDVLVMHADARLPAEGWRRLAAAWRDGDWDVLSPAVVDDAGDPALADAPPPETEQYAWMQRPFRS